MSPQERNKDEKYHGYLHPLKIRVGSKKKKD